MRLVTAFVLILGLVSFASAQTVSDDGVITSVNAQSYSASPEAAGSLTTTFAGGNGFAGNMFDITPTADLQITALDIHDEGVGATSTVDVWYRPGTSFGFEGSSAGWMLIGSYSGVGAGFGLGTFIDMTGNGVTFTGGSSYGMYVNLTSYGVGGSRLNYTNGTPTTYSNADLSLLTNCGKASPDFTGSTFFDRVWNGTVYYDTTAGPTLTVSDLFAGQPGTFDFTNGTPNDNAYLAYSVVGMGSTFVPFLNVTLDLASPKQAGGVQVTDATGATTWTLPIPPGAAGLTVYLQAVQFGVKSNVETKMIM